MSLVTLVSYTLSLQGFVYHFPSIGGGRIIGLEIIGGGRILFLILFFMHSTNTNFRCFIDGNL